MRLRAGLLGLMVLGAVAFGGLEVEAWFGLVGAVGLPHEADRAPTSTFAGLPAAARLGRLRALSNSFRGLVMDIGTAWVSLTGEVVNLQTFGARGGDAGGDEVFNDQAFTDAIAVGKPIYMPPGTYRISQGVLFEALDGIRVWGAGSGASSPQTVLKWVGAANGTALRVFGCRGMYFGDFTITVDAGTSLDYGVKIETRAGSVSTNNYFHRLVMDGGNLNRLFKGFAAVAGSGGDNNNDVGVWMNCQVLNFTTAGWSFEHAQSKSHRLYACDFNAAPGAAAAVGLSTNLGAGNQGGSFQFYGGGGGGCAVDFDIGSPNDYLVIIGAHSENSARFLTTAGPSGSYFPALIQGCRWNADDLHADGRAVIWQHRGPLTMKANTFEGLGKALEIRVNMSGLGGFIFEGNSVDSTLANPFTMDPPDFAIGNLIDRNDGAGRVRLGTVRRVVTATKTADFTASRLDEFLFVNATAGPVTVNLPTLVGYDGLTVRVRKVDATANVVTIDPAGAENVNGAPTLALTQTDMEAFLVADGVSNWYAVVYKPLLENANIAAAAAIAKSKLAALAIVNADVDAAAAIAYSKLNLAASIVNADLAAGATTFPMVGRDGLAATDLGQGGTFYLGVGTGINSPSTTEADEEVEMPGACSVIDAHVRVSFNDTDNTSTFTLRKNGADTALTGTIAAGATGLVTFAGGPVSFAKGERVSIKVAVGAGTALDKIQTSKWGLTAKFT